MKSKNVSTRRGLLAGGNWIIDQVKLIDVFPQREQLANIRSQSEGTGGAMRARDHLASRTAGGGSAAERGESRTAAYRSARTHPASERLADVRAWGRAVVLVKDSEGYAALCRLLSSLHHGGDWPPPEDPGAPVISQSLAGQPVAGLKWEWDHVDLYRSYLEGFGGGITFFERSPRV